jgi:hypothetical protein
MRGPYYRVDRVCAQCGAIFWGTGGANFCSSTCRGRAWRANKVGEADPLRKLCEQVAQRIRMGSRSYSKLLIRLLRATAAELIERDWDPIELLRGRPDDPVTGSDEAPGGVEVDRAGGRTKWLHKPEQELVLIELDIEERQLKGSDTTWYVMRRDELLAKLKPQER